VPGAIRVTRRPRPMAAGGSVPGCSVPGCSVSRCSVSRCSGSGGSGGSVSRTGRVPSGAAVPCAPRTRRRVGGIARRHGATRPDGSAGSHGARARGITRALPRTRSAGRDGLTARRAVAAWHRVAGPRRLAGTPVLVRRHGMRRLAARAMGHPAGAAWVHARRVAGARRLRSGPARGRPFLAAPAGVSPANRPSGSRTGSRGAQDLRDVLAVWGSGRAALPRRVDEPAGCVHVRGIQQGRPPGTRCAVAPGVPAAPAGGRRGLGAGSSAPVIRPAGPRPGPAHPPDGEHHHAERDAGRDEVGSQPGLVRGLVHGRQDGADRYRYGGRQRQDDDEPYPPGRGGSRAHCSTIASRLAARKPNGQL